MYIINTVDTRIIYKLQNGVELSGINTEHYR